MGRALSLQDCYSAEAGLHHPDRLVRVAAIHHLGRRAGKDAHARGLLRGLLKAEDTLVARYSAVTLAQAGDRPGIGWLLQSLVGSRGGDREQLVSCLRCCTRFPFATLLTELVAIESIARCHDPDLRPALHELLVLSSGAFYARMEKEAAFRGRVIGTLSRAASNSALRRDEGVICASGFIVRTPAREEAGLLCSPAGRDFAGFTEEAVVNPDRLQPGQEVIYAGRRGERETRAQRVYAFEDLPPLPPDQLQERAQVTARLLHDDARSLALQQSDYGGAIRVLERVPLEWRNNGEYAEWRRRRERTAQLEREIEAEALAALPYLPAATRAKVKELLELVPGREDLQQLLQRPESPPIICAPDENEDVLEFNLSLDDENEDGEFELSLDDEIEDEDEDEFELSLDDDEDLDEEDLDEEEEEDDGDPDFDEDEDLDEDDLEDEEEDGDDDDDDFDDDDFDDDD